MKRTWADEEMDRLMEMKKEGKQWTQDDWETYFYIENALAEMRWYDSQE